jgi:hypothetical protein
MNEYAYIDTIRSNNRSGLGTIGIQLTSTTVDLVFTPLPSIDINAKVYLNALRFQDDDRDLISFLNASIQTTYALYEGTEVDIKRAFNLRNKTSTIFEKSFVGSSSTIINTTSDVYLLTKSFLCNRRKS